jgi:hypothetical protein
VLHAVVYPQSSLKRFNGTLSFQVRVLLEEVVCLILGSRAIPSSMYPRISLGCQRVRPLVQLLSILSLALPSSSSSKGCKIQPSSTS